MAKRETKDLEQAISDILIQELDIERDQDLTPTARLDALGAGEEEISYIAAHLEHEFEIDCPTTPRSSSRLLRAFTATCANS